MSSEYIFCRSIRAAKVNGGLRIKLDCMLQALALVQMMRLGVLRVRVS